MEFRTCCADQGSDGEADEARQITARICPSPVTADAAVRSVRGGTRVAVFRCHRLSSALMRVWVLSATRLVILTLRARPHGPGADLSAPGQGWTAARTVHTLHVASSIRWGAPPTKESAAVERATVSAAFEKIMFHVKHPKDVPAGGSDPGVTRGRSTVRASQLTAGRRSCVRCMRWRPEREHHELRAESAPPLVCVYWLVPA